MNKKQIILLLSILVTIIVIALIFLVNRSDNNLVVTHSCLTPKPVERGTCKILRGWYYDVASNTCESISGCSTKGDTPFSLYSECVELCIKKV